MSEIAAALEALPLAQHLKVSRWTYPLINAGHVFGIALLVGAIVPMDVAVLRGRTDALWLRRWAVAGGVIAVLCGSLLFVTQASDYVQSNWFLAKMALLGAALVNAALHAGTVTPRAAMVSLTLWPGVLVLGRMIAYG